MELMITVAIIGILSAIAFPSYSRYIARANRTAVQSFMFTVSNKQEQYMLDARSYATGANALTTLNMTLPKEVTGKYSVTVDPVTGPPAGYLITASPQGSQATQDAVCGVLTLNHKGEKTKSGTGSGVSDCW